MTDRLAQFVPARGTALMSKKEIEHSEIRERLCGTNNNRLVAHE